MLNKVLRSLRKPKADSLSDLQRRFPEHRFGPGSYAGELEILSWGEGARLTVGSYCSFAEKVTIFLGGEHRTDWVTTYPFSVLWKEARQIPGHPRTKGDVTIGSDVWLGRECVIGSGVTIGDGAVVGARAVVTRDVPPYAIVAGNPARVVRQRFSDEQAAALLDIRWWDWDQDRIRTHLPALLSGDIDAFILRCRAPEPGR